MFDTWSCHICGDTRPDAKIAVMSYPLKGFVGASCNVRYCRDRKECYDGAVAASKTGKFPVPKKK